MENKGVVPETVFLFGAGASVCAGVPDTFRFVKEFENATRLNELGSTVKKIIEILKSWHGKDIDVELLLDTLTKLDTKDQEPLLRFFQNAEFVLEGYSDKYPIVKDLKDFIKNKAIIHDQTMIRYLEPLLGFVEENRPLKIFSLNYDTCVEQFCTMYRLQYQDGFDINWNPAVFERADADILLFKMHGSVIWFRSDQAGYMKLPIMTDESSVKLITGERAESLMLYPMQKTGYEEPLLELVTRFRTILHKCGVLIVIGYSFRDDHLLKILFDAARGNPELVVMLVDPQAGLIYQNKLRYFDPQSKIPSSLEGRVVCLPYKFEDALQYLKNDYLNPLRAGLSSFSTCRSSERRGYPARWLECLIPLANAEYIDKVAMLLHEEKVDVNDIAEQWKTIIELHLKVAFNYIANKRQDDAEPYLNKLKKTLKTIIYNRMSVEPIRIDGGQVAFNVRFNVIKSDPNMPYVAPQALQGFLDEQHEFMVTRSGMMTDTSAMVAFKFLRNLISYLDLFSSGRFTLSDYHSVRELSTDEIETLDNLKEEWTKNEADHRLSDKIIELERRLTGPLFTLTGIPPDS
ncbi:SIR2-like domain-containing protein [Dehalogenimonas formicexedens]|uniref:SIR2-like domain-containing protein n=1 Tax=Dehalogenimonas formicexedens TaxID=1839801 RepID=A0A1P8F5N9_9CHLR|nr:SIR2 family protein [Dehalogenimonas formicexedens]APV43662.1 SIR2-like domain-containing protein [Dehalogenimonas formicexedens]